MANIFAKKRIKLGLILNELGEINKLKVEDQELKNAIQKQIQSMPGQQKQVLEYYEKNPKGFFGHKSTPTESQNVRITYWTHFAHGEFDFDGPKAPITPRNFTKWFKNLTWRGPKIQPFRTSKIARSPAGSR